MGFDLGPEAGPDVGGSARLRPGGASLRRHLDLPRYVWERSVARTLGRTGGPSADPTALASLRARATAAGSPALSVCIPVRDRLDLLLPCLSSLLVTSDGVEMEVVIGDTGSRPDSVRVLHDLGVRVLPVPGPFNFSRACNAMAAAAGASRVVFLNNDTQALTPGWAEAVLAAGDDEVVGATLVYPGTRRVQHAGVQPMWEPSWPALNAYRPPRRSGRAGGWALQNVGLGRSLDQLPAANEVMAVTGAFLAVSAQEFARLSGFDDSFSVDLQDIDFCLRARQAGMRVTCRREILFAHRHAATRGRYAFPLADWDRFLARWGAELPAWLEHESDGAALRG